VRDAIDCVSDMQDVCKRATSASTDSKPISWSPQLASTLVRSAVSAAEKPASAAAQGASVSR
jgi:hypothetical protein